MDRHAEGDSDGIQGALTVSTVLLVSPGHAPDRTSRQPWAYLQGIADQLAERDHEVVVVGDGPRPADPTDTGQTAFEAVDSVRDADAVAGVARTVGADACVWSVGPTAALLQARRIPRVADTMVAVVPGPLYTPAEFCSQLSGRNLLELPSYASLFASSLVPRRVFGRFLRTNFDLAVAPTETIVETIGSNGFERAHTVSVPHGSDCGILATAPHDEAFRDAVPTPPAGDYVVNFGPPRTVRGAWDFVEAVLAARERGVDVTGVLLARVDDEDDRAALERIEADLASRGVRDAFVLTDAYLRPTELASFVRSAVAVALPYRIVQSTVPISIIEGLGLGRPVITTDVAGARELVPSSDLVVPPGDPGALGAAIGSLLPGAPDATDGTADRLAGHLPSWDVAVRPLADELANR